MSSRKINKLKDRVVSTVAAGALAVTFITPGISFASSTGSLGAVSNISISADVGTGGKDFCTTINTSDTKLLRSLGTSEEKRSEKEDDSLKKVADARATREQRLEKGRAAWDQKHSTTFDKLQSSAMTDAQKLAVARFKATVTAGIVARRSAVDAAIKIYQSGVDKILADRRTSVDSAASNLKTAVDAAALRSKNDCAAGAVAKTVRANLKADLKNARNSFNASVTAFDKVKTNIQALSDARRASVEKAQADFKVLLEKAQSDLKTAFAK